MHRYILFFAAPLLLVCGSSACISLMIEPINNDLTRVGGYAERDFGWNAPQTVIKLKANGKFITDPDVMVLGDSFSFGNVWQSILQTQSSLSFLSFHYKKAGCISNWIDYALSRPSAKTIVIESVERAFMSRFLNLNACRPEIPIPFELPEADSIASRATWPPEWHILYAFKVAINRLKMDLNPNDSVRGKNVVNSPINADCAKFSNRRADRLLYYKEDEEKMHWKLEDRNRAISNSLQIQKKIAEHGKKFVLIVIPDKLSVYKPCILDVNHLKANNEPDIIKSLMASGVNTPDLLSEFQKNTGNMPDLYYPNDSHLSINGYIMMTETLSKFFTKD